MEIASSPGAATWVAVAAAEAAPPAPAAGHALPTACLNCDTPLTDKFCAHCGQPAATHRFSMGHLLHEIPHAIWHVDKGILFTLRELVLRPGPTVLGYLRGQRARHFAPLSLLLLVTGVASFLAMKLRLAALGNSLNPDASAELREAQAHGAESAMHYMGWIYVAMAPVIGLFVRRALRRTGLNLAEAMVAVLYVTAAGNLLSLLFMPAYYWVSSGAAYYGVTTGSSLAVISYQGWAYGQLLGETRLRGWGRWWRGLLTATAAYLLVMCGAVVIVMALNWGSFKAAVHKEVKHKRALRAAPAAAPPTRP
ncbi:DUF3667 domain-containing protein [Hymenobacter ruricola]|uniref:DUF3667 domain-containing protein n=1 Tax=Hymenobacter ruricola TaxID=2791023 RepID=A0ABS0I243_9BACT|nr:DUF3667 domain-containing protein [Hymenobacter ruricola]MBF9221028.1 DUF3667 domain-containing protein [Hymenobacter ruricola]